MKGLLRAMRLTQTGAARLVGVDDRTVGRWLQYDICTEPTWRLLQVMHEFPEVRAYLLQHCADANDVACMQPDQHLPRDWELDVYSSPRAGVIEVAAFNTLNGKRVTGVGSSKETAFADLTWKVRDQVKRFRMKPGTQYRPVGMHVGNSAYEVDPNEVKAEPGEGSTAPL